MVAVGLTSTRRGKMKMVLLGTALGLMLFTGMAMADVGKVDEALCQKLATDYAATPSALEVEASKQLQVCLAQTLAQRSDTATPEGSTNLTIESQSPSTSPTEATPLQPPQGLRIQ